jgi:hypothetical protein
LLTGTITCGFQTVIHILAFDHARNHGKKRKPTMTADFGGQIAEKKTMMPEKSLEKINQESKKYI